ncbi:MAG TPA: HlyD family efflux transporter periplasmic adaptor subunit [Vicinamibacterales bacterium]|nr:HlyD family efflux transporter periplasmic adaptor subunit [Vicinamibacterales bacterium]
MVDIARPASVKRKKKIRQAIYAGVALLAIVLITVAVSRLKPAAPGIERSTVWIDSVKRGDIPREVRGSGTLVPEYIRWIPATTQGRVERLVLRPGAQVKPETVILELSNPDLLQSVMEAKLAHASALAALQNRKAELESNLLNQESEVANIESAWKTAQLRLAANEQLYKDQLVSELQLKEFRGTEAELKSRLENARKRLEIIRNGIASQLAPQEAEVAQRKAAYDLRLQQLEDLKVKAGMIGVLQVVPVEVGQQVGPGTNLARVADPTVLKAELRIAETQTKDLEIGQMAQVDTRNGVVKGRVARIDPASENGTVGVDITLEGALPPGARPDLSVDGTVLLERLVDVIYVGRPAFGQEESTISLFKLQPETGGSTGCPECGEYTRTTIKLGRSSVNTIEIKEGLQPGDQVILSDTSSYDQFDRIRITG